MTNNSRTRKTQTVHSSQSADVYLTAIHRPRMAKILFRQVPNQWRCALTPSYRFFIGYQRHITPHTFLSVSKASSTFAFPMLTLAFSFTSTFYVTRPASLPLPPVFAGALRAAARTTVIASPQSLRDSHAHLAAQLMGHMKMQLSSPSIASGRIA
ncbi:hypothetical protein BGW80DRAFT_876241 [Lactifluus volemus]|nr:hypothetical protein BGW80DRAFT_876241 [Lactifluus volemus]